MELLDLTRHDPEEYENKVVVWRGCEYLVGTYLGSGVERITHMLINRASGLCLHVLKVWRHPNLSYTPSDIRAKLAAGRTAEFDFAKLIPVSIEIDLPGGRAEMQIYAGGGPKRPDTDADILTRQGDECLNKSRLEDAIDAYEQALAINPNHTHALLNLAAVRSRLGDQGDAYKTSMRARSIEPNYPLHHRACMEYAAFDGLTRLALDDFHYARDTFPNVFDFDDLGAELLLACGYPDAALECARTCLLDASDKQALVEKITAAISSRPRASALIAQARSLQNPVESEKRVSLLREAHEIDGRDPLLIINLGLALARAGRPGEAIPHLMQASTTCPLHLVKVCYANTAFCLIDQGPVEQAMLLLDTTMSQIDTETGGQPLQNLRADLPGRGIWVDERTMQEEPLESAARLVLSCVLQSPKVAASHPNALRFAKLYGEAIGVRL